MSLRIIDATEAPDFYNWVQRFESQLWPPFMLDTPTSKQCLKKLIAYFPIFQLAIEWEGVRFGSAKAIPFRRTGDLEDLPDGGWDTIYSQGILDFECGSTPDTLCLLSISISPAFRGKGYATSIISDLKRRALTFNLTSVVAPVRPTLKSSYPNMAIHDYVQLRRSDGSHFDPWIRTHERAGATIIKPALKSCTIEAPLIIWQNWTNQVFSQSGSYALPEMLVPLKVDVSEGVGRYIEPNVWMVYD
ncbi:GNAT family N-acetyltransferase [Brucella intermedia]|uniref:GNAT family N-acetyltransferase n=1 Tax=Brucella intermedia TaxID=94625 RepID=UPI00235F9477|nr:GNAT family N-acetyltransferase [Brucella intermedia]